jgi:hypothetical protein
MSKQLSLYNFPVCGMEQIVLLIAFNLVFIWGQRENSISYSGSSNARKKFG